jgi:parvulin-like peptidyl-prolyl isomerase
MSGYALRRTCAAIAVLLPLASAAAFAADQDVVVRVGEFTMTGPQITAEFGYSPPALIHQVRRSDNSARLLAVDWYSNVLIAKAAADDKIFAQLPGLEDAANALRNKMIAGRVLPHHVKEKFAADDRELKQFMDMNEELCVAPKRYRIARIGVVVGKKASEPEAQGAKGRIEDVKKRLAAGESFATLADEKSDLTAKGPGGEVGWLSDEELQRTEGSQTITQLKKDQVTDIVPTSEGFVIYKLLDREETRKLSFEECRATLDRVMNERYRAQIARDWVDELAKRYDASMNVDAFAAAVRAVEIDKDWLEKQAAKDAGEVIQP